MCRWLTLQSRHPLTGRSPHVRAEHSMNRRLGHRTRRQPVLAGSGAGQDNIATPRLDASPVQTVTSLWGGQLPTFDTAAAANELLDALVGLWNALVTHQSEDTPFRLTRIATRAKPEGLRRLCQSRIDELEGFIDGLFGNEEAIELPERAHEALENLRKINAMLHGIVELLGRQPAPPASADDVAGTLRKVRELSRIAEQELHAVAEEARAYDGECRGTGSVV